MLETHCEPGNYRVRQLFTEPLTKLVQSDPTRFGQSHPDLPVIRSAHEEDHVIDAEIRHHLADKAHRNLDVLGLCFLLDDFQALNRHLPRQLKVRAGRRAEAKHELSGIDLRKKLGTNLQAKSSEHADTCDDVHRDHNPAEGDKPFDKLAINLEQSAK